MRNRHLEFEEMNRMKEHLIIVEVLKKISFKENYNREIALLDLF